MCELGLRYWKLCDSCWLFFFFFELISWEMLIRPWWMHLLPFVWKKKRKRNKMQECIFIATTHWPLIKRLAFDIDPRAFHYLGVEIFVGFSSSLLAMVIHTLDIVACFLVKWGMELKITWFSKTYIISERCTYTHVTVSLMFFVFF